MVIKSKMRNSTKKIFVIVGASSWLTFCAFFTYGLYGNKFFPLESTEQESKLMALVMLGFFNIVSLIACVYVIRIRVNRLQDAQNWIISSMKSNSANKSNKSNVGVNAGEVRSLISASSVIQRWPWGDHHTETLGLLEAAANRFWIRYDPSDLSTAPTNDMVSAWLVDTKGSSKGRANAIASMLRPDGLPTGPR